MNKILVLYSEPMGYTAVCLKVLILKHKSKVLMFSDDKVRQTPYNFPEIEGLIHYKLSAFNFSEFYNICVDFQPNLVYVSGWSNNIYIKVAKYFKPTVPVVSGCDNQWRGSLRQYVLCLLSPFTIKRYFSHFFVPGIYQYEYVRKLGYPKSKILFDLYSADVDSFNKAFHESSEKRLRSYPHKLVFVGRFHANKGLDILLKAFNELSDEISHDWELILIGNGPLKNQIQNAEKFNIKVLDFMDPSQLINEVHRFGAFVLPSKKEPWGVVIHEFVSAGLPIITSDVCGAGTVFVKNGYNGYKFIAGSYHSLKGKLRLLIEKSDNELIEMGKRSYELSRQITPETYAESLNSIFTS